MIDEHFQLILEEARDGMQKSIEHLAHELGHIRAGRANPAMVEDVRVVLVGQDPYPVAFAQAEALVPQAGAGDGAGVEFGVVQAET